ncbi:MAG TPA: oligosaccharide flippase family protein [Blastocatellia bacterium]
MQPTQTPALTPNAPPADVARVAGRGTLYISAAKLWFILSGFSIHIALTRLLSEEQYGLYQVVIGIVSIINAVVITGTSQTVSKYISQDERRADSVKAKALKMQTAVGGGLALGFFLLAPLIADYLNDARLTNPLRLAALITLAYSFYSVYTGYFNGQKKFLTQAALDATYSTLKLACIVLLVWAGLGVMGGVGGFALAAAGVLALSAIIAGKGKRSGEVRARELFAFQSYLLAFTLVLNLLQKVDLILVKALSSPDAAAASANAGFYGAAINIANITYQVIISATFIVFPLVSQATFADDRELTRNYIANTVRYTLLIMALLATLFSANAAGVLRVIYPDPYQASSGALGWVAFGMLAFGMIYVLTTIISASGRPAVSLVIGVVTLAASAALNAALIPRLGLTGAGLATALAMFTGAGIGIGYLLRRFGALMPKRSLARIASASAIVYGLSLVYAPATKMMIVMKLAALGLLYVAVLIVTREVGRGELQLIRRVLKR